MGVYKRGKDKHGKDIWYIDYYLPGNVRKREKAGTSKTHAEKLHAKRQAEILEGKFNIEKPEIMTFEELCQRFFESATKIRPATIERYQMSCNMLLPHFKGKLIGKITEKEIEKYKQERMKNRMPATVNRDLAFLCRIFNVAKKWKLVTKNPVEEVEKLEEDNLRERYYTLEELPRLLKQCELRSYLYNAVMIALHTGMRKKEVLSLQIAEEGRNLSKVNWIDLKNRCLHLNITKSHRYRYVPLNDTLFALLEKEIQGREPGPFFKVKDIRDSFNNAVKRAHIEDAHFHDLRRTFISHAMMAGYSQEVIQRVVGQDDPGIFKRYAHLSPDMRKQVVDDIGQIFKQHCVDAVNFLSKGIVHKESNENKSTEPWKRVLFTVTAPQMG